MAVKRTDLDEAIAMAARAAGANLVENAGVESASFDKAAGLWTIKSENGQSYKARCLVCADGAPSKLATSLGIVTRAPDGVCSRQCAPPLLGGDPPPDAPPPLC